MGIQRTSKDFNLKNVLRNLERGKRKLTLVIANEAVNHFKQGFVTGGGQTDESSEGWEKRKYRRITQTGRYSKSDGATLVKSGHLKRSIKKITTNWTGVNGLIEVGSKGIPYAEIHNEGGRIDQIVSLKQRRFFYRTFKNTKNEMYLKMSNAWELHIDIPKREFIGESQKLDRKILALIRIHLGKNIKAGKE